MAGERSFNGGTMASLASEDTQTFRGMCDEAVWSQVTRNHSCWLYPDGLRDLGWHPGLSVGKTNTDYSHEIHSTLLYSTQADWLLWDSKPDYFNLGIFAAGDDPPSLLIRHT